MRGPPMPFPRSIKNAVKEIRARAGGADPSRVAARHPWLILCYHRVVPAETFDRAPFPGICVRDDVFADQVGYLARHFDVVTLAKGATRFAARHRDGGDPTQGDRPVATITFDDGYVDNHDVAAPILARYRVPATVFAVADFIESGRALWFDTFALRVADAAAAGRLDALAAAVESIADGRVSARLSEQAPVGAVAHAAVTELKRVPDVDRNAAVDVATATIGTNAEREQALRLMTWAELRALADAGWEVGSHTATHPILPGLDAARLEREVAGSKRTLERELSRRVETFCYPNGDLDATVCAAVAEAGYRCAVTTEEAPNDRGVDPYRYRRAYVGPRTGVGIGDRFSAAVFGDAMVRAGR